MDEEISRFIDITGADSEQARQFLERADGDVQQAMAEFFQAQEDAANPPAAATAPAAVEPEAAAQPAPADYTGPRTLSGAPAAPSSSGWNSGNNSGTSTPNSRSGSNQIRSTGSRGGMSSFSEIRGRDTGSSRGGGGGASRVGRVRRNNEDDEDEEEEDESKGPANFFTGGEKSGLSVQNPNRGGDRNEEDQPEMVRNILKQAEALGRAQAEAGGAGGSGSSSGGIATTNLGFSGRGRTIGDEAASEEPSSSSRPAAATRVTDEMDQDDEEMEGDKVSSEPVIRRLTFWADGFSIGDGPLISSNDPRHEEVLAAINAKRAPLALLNVAFGQPVELRIEKRIHEKYKPPASAPVQPFGGSGNRLGSPAPAMAGAPASTSVPATSTSTDTPVHSDLKVDESQPITQVQLRLGDGSRLVGRFNHTHTVADIRDYINASNPDSTARSYTLQSSFPPKPLADESVSIKDAMLLNAVVIQKWG